MGCCNCQCKEVIDKLKEYFVSTNGVPVERATIPAREFWKMVNENMCCNKK